MFFIDHILLLTGLLILIGIGSSKIATRVGIPGLVLFLVVGMLAGSEGIGGIEFESVTIAHAVGTIALVLILFDGGLQTSFESVKRAWKPAGLMATLGVFTTAALTAVAARYFLGLSWLLAFLLGSIISSTDAAAVFSILRNQGLRLDDRLSATLEMESGTNDPMAIFLTILFLEVIGGNLVFGLQASVLFGLQIGVGALIGLMVGKAGAAIINRIHLDAPGLYPVLGTALALTAFGLAAELGGSGFLAVYLTGLLIGNQRVIFQRGIYLFHDAAAWTSQIVMFTLLGLLSFPRQLWDVAWEGVLLALALTFVARPLMVFTTMPFFAFNFRELTFLSWVGLKGAVPIILAIFPLMYGLPEGRLLFDIVFFVVLLSAITQGWSLPLVARKLGLQKSSVPEPIIHLELSALEHVNADLVEYLITEESPACGHRIDELPLPEEVHIALVARKQLVVPSRGRTRILDGDYVFVVHQRDSRPLMDRLFGGMSASKAPLPRFVENVFDGGTRVGELRRCYGFDLPAPAEASLQDVLRDASRGSEVDLGMAVRRGAWTLKVRRMADSGVDLLGVSWTPDETV